jgi:uncharacterized membrane protein YbhN (UPF0104 family)
MPSLRRLVWALLIGVGLYAAAVFLTGYHQVRDSLASFQWWVFASALALASCNYVLRFLKWQFYLRRLGVTGVKPGHSALIFLSGFVLTVTPGKLGEVFKSAVLWRTHGVSVERTAPIIVAERLTDVIAIVMLVVVGSGGFRGGLYWAAAGALCVAVGLVAISWRSPVRLLLAFMQGRAKLRGWVPRLEAAYENLRLVASPKALVWPVLLSIAGWSLEGIALHLLLVGFGQSVELSFSLFFYATATLAGALIPVPGGLGVTEAMIREQLVLVAGAPEPIATACMILIRLATLWWAVIVGFVALGWLRVLFPGLLSSDRDQAHPADSPPAPNNRSSTQA